MSEMSTQLEHHRTLTIVNKLGLHARAAAKLVTLAGEYQAEISLRKGDRTVNGKSMMGVLMLAAAQGSQVEVRAQGEDAAAALDAIAELVAQRFGEDA